MSKIWVIAKTSFKELIREKFFLVLVFVVFFLIGISLILGEMSFDESQKILADIGFTAIQIAALGIAFFTGSYMISREIEKQTCLLMLARPITRTEFLLGKWGGIALLISLVTFSLPLVVLLLLNAWEWIFNAYVIAFGLWLEALVVLSLVFAFSVVLRPVLAVLSGVVLFMVGNWLEDMGFFAKVSKDEALILFHKVCNWIFPNFYRFNWKNYFFLKEGVQSQDLVGLALHFIPWTILCLVIAISFFRRRDIV